MKLLEFKMMVAVLGVEREARYDGATLCIDGLSVKEATEALAALSGSGERPVTDPAPTTSNAAPEPVVEAVAAPKAEKKTRAKKDKEPEPTMAERVAAQPAIDAANDAAAEAAAKPAAKVETKTNGVAKHDPLTPDGGKGLALGGDGPDNPADILKGELPKELVEAPRIFTVFAWLFHHGFTTQPAIIEACDSLKDRLPRIGAVYASGVPIAERLESLWSRVASSEP